MSEIEMLCRLRPGDFPPNRPLPAAATPIYAATAPESAGQSGAYLRDCAVAMPRPLGVDPTLIDEVWRRSQAALAGAGFPTTW